MFNIYAISMKDFKSYKGSHFLELPQERGIYSLTGRNEANKRLGANGCGKTSLIDAIEWCFYGKTSRELRAKDIINWGAKSCSVTVDFTMNGEEISITRTQNPNKITIDGNPASQDDVDKIIRLNQEAFNCAIILPQFGESFFDLSPTKKLVMFSQIMDLDSWVDRADTAKSKADAVLDEIQLRNKRKQTLEGRIEVDKADIKNLRQKSKSFDEERFNKISAIRAKIKAVKKDIGSLEMQKRKAEKKAGTQDDSFKDMKKQLSRKQAEFDELHDEIKELKWTMRDTNSRISELQDEKVKLEKSKDKVCPTCKQVINSKHIHKQVDPLDSKLETFILKQESVEKKLNKKSNAYSTMQAELAKDERAHRAAVLVSEKAEKELRSIKSDLKEAEYILKGHLDKVKDLSDQKDPYLKIISNKKESMKKDLAEIEKVEHEISELQILHNAYNFWVQGFKRVRLLVIEEALLELEVEINNNLAQLGLSDWKIELDIERENKSGGITKGFSVIVKSPKNENMVKWESFSGGEIQRLRMAGNLGLSNLILSRAGFASRIEIIDEASLHLSTEGVEDLLETLRQRSEDSDKRIWIVDHSIKNNGYFAGVLTAVKEKNGGSRLELR